MASETRERIRLERTYPHASAEEVWGFFTTSEGLASILAPEGFEITVDEIEVRPGGQVRYAMTATGADQAAYMASQGMPATTHQVVTYLELQPHARLAFEDLVSFVPGVEPYPVRTDVELSDTPAGCSLVMTFDAMHDELWTRMGTMGREQELDNIGRLLEQRRLGS